MHAFQLEARHDGFDTDGLVAAMRAFAERDR